MSHGPVMWSLEGLEVTAEEREMLEHPATGGVILFSRNYHSPQQLEQLITEIHVARSPTLLVAVDQEGGRVQRFKEGFTELPAAARFGDLYRQSREQGKKAARDVGWLMASELRVVGVDFSFSPVLDVDHGISEVIGDRAFGNNDRLVADLALSWSMGAREAGMASVGKHFPGHGGVRADSHYEIPEDNRDMDEIRIEDLPPFRRLIENGLEGIMPAHVIYSKVDDLPAGFSQHWISRILRRDLAFSGVIFSDDLSMAAAHVAGSYAERARVALEAGCDMVLVCNNPQGAAEVLDELADYRDPVSQSRLVRMHGRHKISTEQLKENPRWRRALDWVSLLTEESSLSLDL